MKLFRIEHTESQKGMWNTFSAENKPLVTYLSNRVVAELPMPHDDRYGLYGRRWYSAADSLEMLDYWFKEKDINELISLGFEVFEIEASEYERFNQEMIFTKESVIEITNITNQFKKQKQL